VAQNTNLLKANYLPIYGFMGNTAVFLRISPFY